jgi:hypothetical protein
MRCVGEAGYISGFRAIIFVRGDGCGGISAGVGGGGCIEADLEAG